MKWRDEYATGIQRVDEQHKSLFRMADDFRMTLDEGGGERTYGTLLDLLDGYCRGHFRFEERCMEEYRCPVAKKNKEAHSMFMATLRDYQQRYAASGYLAADACELVNAVDRWLDEHICRIDVHLRNCVKK